MKWINITLQKNVNYLDSSFTYWSGIIWQDNFGIWNVRGLIKLKNVCSLFKSRVETNHRRIVRQILLKYLFFSRQYTILLMLEAGNISWRLDELVLRKVHFRMGRHELLEHVLLFLLVGRRQTHLLLPLVVHHLLHLRPERKEIVVCIPLKTKSQFKMKHCSVNKFGFYTRVSWERVKNANWQSWEIAETIFRKYGNTFGYSCTENRIYYYEALWITKMNFWIYHWL